MATTTNYSWTTPDDTALVKDGAAAIRSLGTSIDTTTKALNPSTTLGDIEYRSSSANTNTRLPIGTTGQVLAVVGGVPAWATTADQTPLTNKGDIFTFTTVDARLGVGANGTVLTADSAEATGLKWATPAAAGGMTVISSGSLSGSEVSITSIPGTYKKLELVVANYLASADGNNFNLRFNNDTSANRHSAFSVNADVRNRTFDSTECPIGMSQDNGVGTGLITTTIPNYANTTSQKIGFTYGITNNATTATNMNSLYYVIAYNQTAAITSLQLRFDGGTASGGTYILYGVN